MNTGKLRYVMLKISAFGVNSLQKCSTDKALGCLQSPPKTVERAARQQKDLKSG